MKATPRGGVSKRFGPIGGGKKGGGSLVLQKRGGGGRGLGRGGRMVSSQKRGEELQSRTSKLNRKKHRLSLNGLRGDPGHYDVRGGGGKSPIVERGDGTIRTEPSL